MKVSGVGDCIQEFVTVSGVGDRIQVQQQRSNEVARHCIAAIHLRALSPNTHRGTRDMVCNGIGPECACMKTTFRFNFLENGDSESYHVSYYEPDFVSDYGSYVLIGLIGCWNRPSLGDKERKPEDRLSSVVSNQHRAYFMEYKIDDLVSHAEVWVGPKAIFIVCCTESSIPVGVVCPQKAHLTFRKEINQAVSSILYISLGYI